MSWSFTISGHSADPKVEGTINEACAALARSLVTEYPGKSEGSTSNIVDSSSFTGATGGWQRGAENDPTVTARSPADDAQRGAQAAGGTTPEKADGYPGGEDGAQTPG